MVQTLYQKLQKKMIKNKLKIFAALISVLLILSSCENIEKKKRISKIVELEITVQKMQDELFNSKMDSVILAFGEVNNTLAFLNKNGAGKVSDTVFINRFAEYTKIKKQLKSLNEQLNILVSDIQYTKSQLGNLKKDILKNSLKIEEIEKYLMSEQKAVIEIQEKFKPALEKIIKRMKSYHEMRPVMKKFQEELENLEN